MQHLHVKKSEQTHESGSNHNSTTHAHSERFNGQCTGVPLYLQRQAIEEEEEEAVPEREESDPEESAPILESVPTRDADELG